MGGRVVIAVEPGKRVAVVPLGQGAITFATVKTVGKRFIVLDNGARYSIDRQDRRVGGTWGTTYSLADVDDPGVVKELRERRIRNRAGKIAETADRVAAGRSEDLAADARVIRELAGRLVTLVNGPVPAPPVSVVPGP